MFKQSRIGIILIVSLLFNMILAGIVAYNVMRPAAKPAAEAQTVGAPNGSVAEVATIIPMATSTPTTQSTAIAELVVTATPTFVATDTAVPSPTNTSLPPTATATPLPTNTPFPTDTPAPTPTNTPPPIPQPNWLAYINQFRQIARIPLVREDLDFTIGSAWHSSYMVLNDAPIAHTEDPGNDLFDETGDIAARQGNIFATTQTEAKYNWAINFWFSAPFHALPLLDPRLETIGYGDFVQDAGTYKMAAVTDVRSGTGELSSSINYPVFFPGDGAKTWITRLSMHEWPDPYANCPGYQQPTGPAILMQLGTGELEPHVTAVAFTTDEQVLEVCTYNETNYINDNVYAQEVGRSILGARDAIVILPREQLIVGQTYKVFVTVNGETYSWSFEATRPTSQTTQ